MMKSTQEIQSELEAIKVAIDAVLNRPSLTAEERFGTLDWLFGEHRARALWLAAQKTSDTEGVAR